MMGTVIKIEQNIDIPMRDGIVLRGDLWRPDDNLARPVILFRTPYNKSQLSTDSLKPQWCVDAGYASIVQDTRGRFASDGEWAAIMWEREGADTYDTVEWISKQKWCDGNVGMVGPSYLGIVQWMGAAQAPPHLKAIAPIMTTNNDLEPLETGGAVRLDHLISWMAFMAADWVAKAMGKGQQIDPAILGKVMALIRNPGLAMDYLPIRENPYFDIPGFPVDFGKLIAGEIESSASWHYEDISIPTLSVGSWYDVFNRATIQSFLNMQTNGGGGEEIRQSHGLIMGPWAHVGALMQMQGEVNFGVFSSATGAQLPQWILAFFDKHLKGAKTAIPKVRYFLMGANEWREAEAWPTSQVQEQSWYLHSLGQANTAMGDGLLSGVEPGKTEPADQYLYDPMNPIRTHGGRVLYLGNLVGGPLNQQHLEGRTDVLCYTSEPLDSNLDVVGLVSLKLFASSTAKDTDFMAKLTDVYPDGRSILVCDGCLRARYRKGFDSEIFLESEAVEEYLINLGHTAWRFQPTHRLRVHVCSSNFPHLDRNMNTGDPIGTDSQAIIARQTVFHEKTRPSHLALSILSP
jgi:putative CocE/NonD family hydrolase